MSYKSKKDNKLNSIRQKNKGINLNPKIKKSHKKFQIENQKRDYEY